MSPASDHVQKGHDMTFSDGSVIHVTKRNGNLLEGIRVERKAAEGTDEKVEADTGAIYETPGARETRIVLTNAHVFQSGKKSMTVGELNMNFLKSTD